MGQSEEKAGQQQIIILDQNHDCATKNGTVGEYDILILILEPQHLLRPHIAPTESAQR